VLVVDDSLANRELIEASLEGVDCDIRMAGDGQSALDMVHELEPDLVLLDVQMPGVDGHAVCRQIKSTPDGRLIPVVMITGLRDVDDRVTALENGADDFLSKPVDRSELLARVRSLLRLKAVYDTLDNAQRVIYALGAAVEARDPYTDRHAQRVADMARRIGGELGLSDTEVEDLYRGALIHDIGKVGIPDSILLKPGPLTDVESAQMRLHPVIGAQIVNPLHSGTALLSVIRHHHEHVDGTGYPDGLAGESIPMAARIVAVCDAHDALISDRPYRKRRSEEEALATLRHGAGAQWDAKVVDLFLTEIRTVAAV
jgi:putative two-component system response regulator